MSEQLRQLPVEIRVQACSGTMTLNQFLCWSPGTVLTFDQSVTNHLPLQIGKKVIGHGQAVVARDRLAIQIRQLQTDPPIASGMS